MLDVIMAGEREEAGQFLEAITMGITRDRFERLPRIAAREQIENAEPLLGAGRGIEPGHKAFVTRIGLTDAKSVIPHLLAIVATVPDELQVVRFVLRIEKLVRRRKYGE